MSHRRSLLLVSQVALLAAAATVGGLVSSSDQWTPLPLAAALLALAVASNFLGVRIRGAYISGAFMSIVLAMALLGPAPAAAIGVASMLIDELRSRRRPAYRLNNLATFAAFPLAGGLVIQAAVHATSVEHDDVGFSLLLLGVFVLSNVLNFTMIAGYGCLLEGGSLRARFRRLYLPVLPMELVTGLLTVGVGFVYVHVGLTALVLFATGLFSFQHLIGALLVSQDRAEELEHRTTQLASLQVGLLTAMIQTLSLRDHMTARHSAAVARYSRELAKAAGCSEAEQDLVHTAGLLHDIGKFIFPDSILFAERRLSDEDWEVVKRHPAQGAKVVRQIDGYGPVADIILCHHERIDGGGYPRGVPGADIPLLSRMISIADTYDTMTARESYRQPVSPAEAIAELRRVSGTQLDGDLVAVFVEMLARKGVAFQHADDADFAAELAFERRVARHAAPHALAS